MELENWITNVVVPSVSGIAGWLVGKRKRNVEIESEELRNVKDTLDIYMKMIEDLKTHQQYLDKRLGELMTENANLTERLLIAKERIDALEVNLKTAK
jgi:mevalonate kinase